MQPFANFTESWNTVYIKLSAFCKPLKNNKKAILFWKKKRTSHSQMLFQLRNKMNEILLTTIHSLKNSKYTILLWKKEVVLCIIISAQYAQYPPPPSSWQHINYLEWNKSLNALLFSLRFQFFWNIYYLILNPCFSSTSMPQWLLGGRGLSFQLIILLIPRWQTKAEASMLP